MKRTYVKEAKGKVKLCGWVHEVRDLAKIKFFLLRDMTGVVQCTIKNKKLFKEFSKLTLESVVCVEGAVKKAKVTSGEVTRKDAEVDVNKIEVLSKSEKLPIQVLEKDRAIRTDLSKRLDWRSLDMRKKRVQAIFKVQAEIVKAFREFFSSRNFFEIQPPCIIATATEGGAGLFSVKYFDKQAFLAQSPQLYKQLCAISLEKVFSVMPVWRAEKHDTSRHLNEVRQLDIEVAFADDFDVMKLLEESVRFIVTKVQKNCKNELSLLKVKLKIPKAKYLSYGEAVKLLNKKGIKFKLGEDIPPEGEKKLCELFSDTIVLTHSWPLSLKPFYIWPKDNKISAGFDAVCGGTEISSGGQRVHKPEILIKRLREQKLNPENFKHYINSFRYGAPYHAGWSIGLERFTMALLGLDNIREACLFPRDRERLTP